MIITAISDMHGNLVDIPKCDVLCICGDIVGLNAQRSMDASKHWFENRFVNWINKLPCDKVLVIPGNHDFYIEECYTNSNGLNDTLLFDIEIKTNNKLKFLIDISFIYEGLKFYGTPWINPIRSRSYWAFEQDQYYDNLLETKFSKIPIDTDILISHDNPYNNETLSKYSMNARYHFYGHWHEGVTSEKRNRYNCSLLNDSYYLKYKPITIDVMTNKDRIDLLNDVISMIKEETDFNDLKQDISSTEDLKQISLLEQRFHALKEVIDIVNSFIPVPPTDKEDEVPWDDVITSDITIENQLNDDNNESD